MSEDQYLVGRGCLVRLELVHRCADQIPLDEYAASLQADLVVVHHCRELSVLVGLSPSARGLFESGQLLCQSDRWRSGYR